MQFITPQNKDGQKLIHDIVMHPLKVNKDESGILVETLRTDWQDVYGPGREFAMQYFSVTPSGVIRDEKVWHYHPGGQEDRFLVAQGEIVVAVADGRKGSPTEGLLNLFYMHAADDPYLLVIPKQTLHGFMTVSKSDAVLLNFPTRLYDPNEEVRVPHEEAEIKNAEGRLFSWGQVKKVFSIK